MVTRSLFARLIDDAALFPPGNAPMDRALVEHATYRAAAYSDVVGPFLCPASRVEEMLSALGPDQSLALAIVFDVTGDDAHAALRAAAVDRRVTLVAVEAAYARLGDDAAAVGANLARMPSAVGFLEVPRTGFDAALDLVESSGWHAAKYRTGGATPEAFPTEAELASFLVASTTRGLPFKLTAGLHHAVRSTAYDGSGSEQHGLLNVLVATRVAQQDGDVTEVAAVLAQREPGPLVEFLEAWDEPTCTDVRRAFLSFGCCGVTDPIDDLVAAGVLDAA